MRRRTFLRGLAATAALALGRRAAAGPRFDRAAADSAAARADTSAAGAPEITLVAAGDVVLGYNLQDHFDRLLAEGEPREALFERYFSGVCHLFEAADLAVVNLECPFTERGTKVEKNFNFRARPELVEILKRGSVDVVSCANNHVKDFGPEGIDDTLATLDAAGIAHFGAGRTLEAARAPRIVERGGLRVGFVGWYFQVSEDMFEPKVLYATRWTPGVAGCYVDLDCIRDMVREDVARLVPQVDVAIPFFHWGKEGSLLIREYQVELAHLCVDLGARLVLGAHPHRFQGIEVYRGAPIVYSLGNFVYGGIKEPRDTLSAVVRVAIPRDSAARAELVPVRYTRWPDDPFRPVVLEGGERAGAIALLSQQSRAFPETLPMLARGAAAR